MAARTQALPRVKRNLLWLSYIAFVALGLPTSLLGVAWPTLRAEFNLPLDALGLLFISSTVGYLISSFFIARLLNRFGIGSLLLASSLLSAVCLFAYTVSPSWSLIVVLMGFGGLASGTLDAGLNTYLAAEYNESQMQWLHASFGLGATLSPLIMTASLAQFISWRPAYLLASVVMVLMAVAFLLTLSSWRRPQGPFQGPQTITELNQTGGGERGLMDYQTSLWETLLRPVTWIAILLFLLYTGAELVVGNWTYTLLTEGRGISPQLAGLWAGGFWATFTFGRILGGLFAHRIRLDTLMLGAMVLALAGAILFWWNPLALVSLLGVFIVGFALAPIFAGLVSSTRQRVGERHAANAIGIQLSAASLGSALLPSLAGALAQRISLETIPVMLVVSLLGLLGLYRLSMRTWNQ